MLMLSAPKNHHQMKTFVQRGTWKTLNQINKNENIL